MKRNHFILVGMVAIVIIAMTFFDNKETIASNTTSKSGQNEQRQEMQEDKVKTKAASPRRKIQPITENEILDMKDALPAIEKIKEEVRSNPHATPPSLLKFAQSMYPLMEKALKDEGDARVLINALQDCALDESSAHAARVLCVTNSERLAVKHRDLRSKAGKIRANVDPQVKKILNRQDSLVR